MLNRLLWFFILLIGCGTQPHTNQPDGGSASPDAAITDTLPSGVRALLLGQSNDLGRGLVSDLSDPSYAQPLPSVVYYEHGADAPSDPIPWKIDTTGPLAPTSFGTFGVELSFARDVGAVAISKIAVSGSDLANQWGDTSTYPTMPQGGPSLHNQATAELARIHATVVIWIQSEADATSPFWSEAYGANLEAFIRSLGDVCFLYNRLSIQNTAAGRDAVRAGQEGITLPNAHMVDVDDIPVDSTTHQHFLADGLIEMGHRFAAAERACETP